MRVNNLKLQFITHFTDKYSYIDSARVALEGGCRWIQLRMKDVPEATLAHHALIIQKMCKDYGATFIIDDNVYKISCRIRINLDVIFFCFFNKGET